MFQIILVSSSLSDRDQSLFLSTDEGATFQKQLIPFSVETFIFHPRVEDKVLAYTREGKVSRPEPFHHVGPGTPPSSPSPLGRVVGCHQELEALQENRAGEVSCALGTNGPESRSMDSG